MRNQNLQCPFCEKKSSRGTGLASHIRGAHSEHYRNWTANRQTTAVKTGRRGRPPGSGAASRAASSGGLRDIVATLERQKAALDRALQALQAF